MPHFSAKGNDMYLCQVCGGQFDSVDQPPVWRPDITGHQSAGNVCPKCLQAHSQPSTQFSATRTLSLYEHCKLESGLTDPAAIQRYMNRYYGHA